MDNPNVLPNGASIVDMGAYEIPGCATPADLFPTCRPYCGFGDGFVGAGDLAELLANWGACPGCCADIAPVGALDGNVGAGDLAELLANWGNVPDDCDTGGAEGFGGGGVGAGGDDVQYDEVEMTDELFDMLMNMTYQELWDWVMDLVSP